MIIGNELVGGQGVLVQNLQEWGYLDKAKGIEQDAVVLFQENYINILNPLCNHIHGRQCISDGQIGPATALLINTRFCNVTDFANNEEEARWPDDCVNEINVSWNFDQMPGLTKEQTLEAWRSLSQYEQLFNMKIPLQPNLYPNTRIYSALRPLPGSTLAWSNLATNSCAFRAQQAYDSSISWSLKMAIGTIRHEVGHALGMNHTPNDQNSIMFPSMRGQTELNETDINQMIRLGYKKRTIPIPPGPIDVVLAKIYINNQLKYELTNQKKENGNVWWP